LPVGLVAFAAVVASCGAFDTGSTDAPPDAGSGDGGATPPDSNDAAADAVGVTDATETDAGPSPPLAAPALWLDARTIPIGPEMTTWPDRSGHGADATGATTVTALSDGIHARPAVHFLGVANQGMAVAPAKFALSATDGFAIFVVAKAVELANPPTFPTLIDRETANPDNGVWMFWQSPSQPLVQGALFSSARDGGIIPDGAGLSVLLSPAAIYDAHVYSLRVASGNLDFQIDGAGQPATAAKAFEPFLTGNQAPFTVAGRSAYTNADYSFVGFIGSVTVYTRALSDADYALAIATLKSDWGI
jgi:hypothetical protein